jgi:hypothetical protein
MPCEEEKEAEEMTIDEFVEKWWDGHRNISLGKDLMKADLKEMLEQAKCEGIDIAIRQAKSPLILKDRL